VERNLSISNFKAVKVPILIIVLYITLEVLYRSYFFGIHTVFNLNKYNARGILVTDIMMPVDDPAIRWRLRPNVDTIFKASRFTTNSFGFREREVLLENPDDKFRIAVLGRSITMGAAVLDEDIYTRQLQEKLDLWEPDKYEVLNFGIGGYKVNQIVALYEKIVKQFNPDLVILPIFYKELDVSIGKSSPPLSYARPKWTNLRGYLSYTFIYEAFRLIIKRKTNLIMSTDWRERSSKVYHQKIPMVKTEEIVSQFVKRRKDEGIPVVIVSLRRIGEIRRSKWPKAKKRMENWVKSKDGVEFIDTHPFLEGKMSRRDYVYFGDNHPNAQAHKLYAEVISNQLESLLFHYSLNNQITIGE